MNLKFFGAGGAGGGADPNAIHDNVAAEINAIAEKVAPIAADLVIIEDSADANNKKKAQVGNLPGGGGGGGYTEGARVYNSANISIPNSTVIALTFDSERYDTDTIHDPATNPSRLTCKTAGKYIISGCIAFAANNNGSLRQISIRVNGTTTLATQRLISATNDVGTIEWMQEVSTIYELAIDEYVELTAYQDSTVALNVLAAGNYSPEFMMSRIG
ncbi:hypothetical protein LCGC14_2697240 [marine sediment metagenome]|uniref:C1q domain-containing protein n=1 Tax=marine sediment metagenome TaxID=412755 RepID=A0A0F9BR86_9ZZZZ